MKKKSLVLLTILMLLLAHISFAGEPSSWAKDEIDEMMERPHFNTAVFKDYQKDLTRLEFIEIVISMYELMIGEEIELDDSIVFSDTSSEFALKAATVGITTGIGDGRFGPDLPLNREQLAVMIVRTLQLLQVELVEPASGLFDDHEEISSWAVDAIYLAKSNGIISGVGNNLVNPKGMSSKEVGLMIANRVLNEKNYKPAVTYKGESVFIVNSFAPSFGELKELDELNLPEYGTDSIFGNAQGTYRNEHMNLPVYLSESYVQLSYADYGRVYVFDNPIIDVNGDVITITSRENGQVMTVEFDQEATKANGYLVMHLSIFGEEYRDMFYSDSEYDPSDY